MWVLSTSRAEHHFFPGPSAIPGGYAILSHTWSRSGELSFQQVQDIGVDCKATGQNPRSRVDEKIRMCCEVAERDGYAWVWIDSCCINKESSTELSESINSMFNWYILSEVCYAYLEDVPGDQPPSAKNSKFRRSRWHTRGWTLQELLAPAFLIFMSKEWQVIGTKHSLSGPLSERTGISEEFLTRERKFFKASVAERMSWAATRNTTRLEDEAYCLLGLFNTNLPILYGEGRQAFQRLQQELARQQYVDTTLFAWGALHDDDCLKLPASPLSQIWAGFHGVSHPERFLFAMSPSDFASESTAFYTPTLGPKSVLQPYLPSQWPRYSVRSIGDINKKENGPFGRIELPSCEATGYGMKCRFPVAEVDGITIAVLLAETSRRHLGIILHPAREAELQDPSRKMYYVTWPFRREKAYINCRLAFLGNNLYDLRFRGKPMSPTWRDIYIHTSPGATDRTDPPHLVLRLHSDQIPSPFRVPRRLVQAMIELKLLPDSGTIPCGAEASMNMWVEFKNIVASEKIHVQFGLCAIVSKDGVPSHWAYAMISDLSNWTAPWGKTEHDCLLDHVDNWRDGGRTFGDHNRTVRLAFTRCTHSPVRTRVLEMELSGRVYDAIQREAGFTVAERTRVPQRPLVHEEGLGSPSMDHEHVIPEETSRRGCRPTCDAIVVVSAIVSSIIASATITFLSSRATDTIYAT